MMPRLRNPAHSETRRKSLELCKTSAWPQLLRPTWTPGPASPIRISLPRVGYLGRENQSAASVTGAVGTQWGQHGSPKPCKNEIWGEKKQKTWQRELICREEKQIRHGERIQGKRSLWLQARGGEWIFFSVLMRHCYTFCSCVIENSPSSSR